MILFERLYAGIAPEISIDLGTANTPVHVRGYGVRFTEPTVVAIDTDTGEVVTVGEGAKQMVGRTPRAINVIRPMRNGVISNYRYTEALISQFGQRALRGRPLIPPRVIVGVPGSATEVEKKAVREAARGAGAGRVYFVPQALASAVGAGLPILDAVGSMIVDIGGGTTDVAVISLAGIVYSRSVRVAGNEMDDAIIQYIKRKYNLLIGERTGEQVKMESGSAFPLDEEMTMEIKGRDLVEGVPKTLVVSDEEIREALSETVATIVEAVRVALERTPPELSADIMDKGIIMAGGGSMLKNLDRRLREETGLPVTLAEDPLACVALGTGQMLTDFNLLRKISIE